MKKGLFLFIVLLTVAACTSTQPVPSSTPLPPTHTSLPPTHTSIPPTQTPPPFEVTFDGEECTINVPAELPAENYSFVLKNLSDIDVEFLVARFTEGKTNQDTLDLQSEPGEYYEMPRWAVHTPKLREDWDESFGGVVYTFSLKIEGAHGSNVGGLSPPSLYICAPGFQVIEAPSE